MFHLHVCMCMPGSNGGQKMALGPLELELQLVVSHRVQASNGTWILYKSNKCSLLFAIGVSGPHKHGRRLPGVQVCVSMSSRWCTDGRRDCRVDIYMSAKNQGHFKSPCDLK